MAPLEVVLVLKLGQSGQGQGQGPDQSLVQDQVLAQDRDHNLGLDHDRGHGRNHAQSHGQGHVQSHGRGHAQDLGPKVDHQLLHNHHHYQGERVLEILQVGYILNNYFS